MNELPWPTGVQNELDKLQEEDNYKNARVLEFNIEFLQAKEQEKQFTSEEREIAKQHTLRYMAQSGTDYSELQLWMWKTYLKFLTDPSSKPSWLK